MATPTLAINPIQQLSMLNEDIWITMGTMAERMHQFDMAMEYYERAKKHNMYPIKSLLKQASLCRSREQLKQAIRYYKDMLNMQNDEDKGETLAALGHCYLMTDDLDESYNAYQHALAPCYPRNREDPKLWYGVGILYDRYGSIEFAEEAFSAVIQLDPKFEKANEIYFRLGIIYKQQQKLDRSEEFFQYILHSPPKPLSKYDIWFQIGNVREQQKEFGRAKEAYEYALEGWPDHAKVLQQLGWLFYQPYAEFRNLTRAIQYLTDSLKADENDAQTWYLLGRCYMVEQNYNKAYESYQQAVNRDAGNPAFWCSIGVLYYQISQYKDALDAYSRAIKLNDGISEVWYDLGTLYESCNNQVQDALDAYKRAEELDPKNPIIKQRLELLRNPRPGGNGPIPEPCDVTDPNQYQSELNTHRHTEPKQGSIPHTAQGREFSGTAHSAPSYRQYHPSSSTVYSPYPSEPNDVRAHSTRIPTTSHHTHSLTTTDPLSLERPVFENRSRARHLEGDLLTMHHPGSPQPSAPTYATLPPPPPAAATPSRSMGLEESHDESAADMLLSIGRSGSFGASNGSLSSATSYQKRRLPSTTDMEDIKRLRLSTSMAPPLSSPPPQSSTYNKDHDDRATPSTHFHSNSSHQRLQDQPNP